jgi:hypothetical protein
MTRYLTALALSIAFFAGCWSSARGESATSSVRSFDDYKLIVERNIFDPNRREVRKNEPDPASVLPQNVPAETVSLVGTLVHRTNKESERVAFFIGSAPGNTLSAKIGDTVAEMKVQSVQMDNVILKSGKTTFEIPVGKGLRRNPGESWKLDENAYVPDAAATMPQPQNQVTRTDTPTESSPPSGSANDVLRRMMERRKQEMGK